MELKERAMSAIRAGDARDRDVRFVRVRLRDEAGDLLFEGTMEEASRLQVDGRVSLTAR